MKFYILTSSLLEGVHRATKVIPSKDMVVVINTPDKEYVERAVDYCNENELEYYVTESDGTPATGKNSVLKLFLESDNDYMVHVDGDDIITHHGYRLYTRMAKHESPPDMVVLYRQPQIRDIIDFDYVLNEVQNLNEQKALNLNIKYPYDKSDRGYEDIDHEYLIYYFKKYFLIKDKTANRWATDRVEFANMMNKYSESKEFMTRMVFISRNIAQEMYYDPALIVGEDTIQFLKLKRLAVEGKYNIIRRKERNVPTYISNYNEDSITNIVGRKGNDWDWIRPLVDEILKLGNLPEDINLPELDDATYL